MNAWDEQVWARTGWMEARGQGEVGIIAVLWAIKNRVLTGKWGHTPAAVCLYGAAFSCWNALEKTAAGRSISNRNRDAMARLTDDHPDLQKIVALVRQVDRGLIQDPTHGATFYHRVDVNPDWEENMVQTAQIGDHVFSRPA